MGVLSSRLVATTVPLHRLARPRRNAGASARLLLEGRDPGVPPTSGATRGSLRSCGWAPFSDVVLYRRICSWLSTAPADEQGMAHHVHESPGVMTFPLDPGAADGDHRHRVVVIPSDHGTTGRAVLAPVVPIHGSGTAAPVRADSASSPRVAVFVCRAVMVAWFHVHVHRRAARRFRQPRDADPCAPAQRLLMADAIYDARSCGPLLPLSPLSRFLAVSSHVLLIEGSSPLLGRGPRGHLERSGLPSPPDRPITVNYALTMLARRGRHRGVLLSARAMTAIPLVSIVTFLPAGPRRARPAAGAAASLPA